VSVQGDKKAGDALASALGGAGGPHSTDAGRALLLALVRLHELGALAFDTENDPDRAAAVHRARPQAEPGPVVGCDPAQAGQTAHAYNMGSLSASGSDTE